MNSILFAIWFLLPGAIANVTPILAAKSPGLMHFDSPIDGGHKFLGKDLFGAHKTWRGLITGIIAATLVFILQQWLVRHFGWAKSLTSIVDYNNLPIYLGSLLGFGALGGDCIESFFKRQRNIRSGHTWVPFDQLDYIIGAVLISLPVLVLPLIVYFWIFVLWFVLHIASTYIGWKLGLKKDPI